MERAEALVDGARTFECDGLADDVDDRELRLDFGNDAGRSSDYGGPLARRSPRVSRGLSSTSTSFYQIVKFWAHTDALRPVASAE